MRVETNECPQMMNPFVSWFNCPCSVATCGIKYEHWEFIMKKIILFVIAMTFSSYVNASCKGLTGGKLVICLLQKSLPTQQQIHQQRMLGEQRAFQRQMLNEQRNFQRQLLKEQRGQGNYYGVPYTGMHSDQTNSVPYTTTIPTQPW